MCATTLFFTSKGWFPAGSTYLFILTICWPPVVGVPIAYYLESSAVKLFLKRQEAEERQLLLADAEQSTLKLLKNNYPRSIAKTVMHQGLESPICKVY